MFMHLMDETPDIVEKITEKQVLEKTIKKQKSEERITKATTNVIPEGVQKIGKIYQKRTKTTEYKCKTLGYKNRKERTT